MVLATAISMLEHWIVSLAFLGHLGPANFTGFTVSHEGQ